MLGDMIGWCERIARPHAADLQNSITGRPPSGPHGGGVLSGLSDCNHGIPLPEIHGTQTSERHNFLKGVLESPCSYLAVYPVLRVIEMNLPLLTRLLRYQLVLGVEEISCVAVVI